jgi:ribosomal protein S14
MISGANGRCGLIGSLGMSRYPLRSLAHPPMLWEQLPKLGRLRLTIRNASDLSRNIFRRENEIDTSTGNGTFRHTGLS